jgi:protein TonB
MSTDKNNQFKGNEHIEVKKSAKVNLEQHKTVWLLIGFIMVFAVLFVAFEWTTFEDKEARIIATAPPPAIEEPEVLKEIQIQVKHQLPPPPQAQKPAEVIEIIKDEIDQQESEIISTEEVVFVAEVSNEGMIVIDDEPEEEQIFQVVEQPAEFPGGMQAMYKWLSDNIQYPRISRDNNSQGRTILRFVVNSDGSIQGIEVIKSSGDMYLDKEAVRVVDEMPRWSPGKQAGKAVRCWFTLPVMFRLQ